MGYESDRKFLEDFLDCVKNIVIAVVFEGF